MVVVVVVVHNLCVSVRQQKMVQIYNLHVSRCQTSSERLVENILSFISTLLKLLLFGQNNGIAGGEICLMTLLFRHLE